MPFLLGAIPWRLLAVIGIVAGLSLGAVYITSQLKKVGKLEAQLDSAIEVGNQNALLYEEATRDFQRVRAIMLERARKQSASGHKADLRRAKINEAPPSDDAPLAPVLKRTLDELQPNPGTEGVGKRTVSSPAP